MNDASHHHEKPAQPPTPRDDITQVVRNAPIRSVLLFLNAAITALIILSLFSWVGLAIFGAIALMAAASLGANAQSRFARLDRFIRFSPMTFFLVYFLWAAGELFLRLNPMLVGGGGGGNPALRVIYEGLYEFNDIGLRDRPRTPTPAPDVYRILALGDSITFGQGVPFDDTFPQVLERRLNTINSPFRYEVINAGKRGVNTVWELEWLKNTGLAMEPDLVTIQFYMNDVEHYNHDDDTEPGLRDYIMTPFRHSHAIFFLKYRMKLLLRPPDRRIQIAKLVNANTPSWKQCKAAIADLGQLSLERNIPVVFIFFPHPGEPHQANEVIRAAVIREAAAANLPCLDLTHAFEHIPPDEQVVSVIDEHPSAATHHHAADIIYEFLRDSQFLKPSHRNASTTESTDAP